MLLKIAESLKDISKKDILINHKLSAQKLIEIIEDLKIYAKDLILIIDDLNKLRITDLNVIISLIENFTVFAAARHLEENRLKKLWWKFKKIEIDPLDQDFSKQLIKHLTQHLTIENYEFLETKILNESNGLPLAMVDMIKILN